MVSVVNKINWWTIWLCEGADARMSGKLMTRPFSNFLRIKLRMGARSFLHIFTSTFYILSQVGKNTVFWSDSLPWTFKKILMCWGGSGCTKNLFTKEFLSKILRFSQHIAQPINFNVQQKVDSKVLWTLFISQNIYFVTQSAWCTIKDPFHSSFQKLHGMWPILVHSCFPCALSLWCTKDRLQDKSYICSCARYAERKTICFQSLSFHHQYLFQSKIRI